MAASAWGSGEASRMTLVRVLPGTDLLEGILGACRDAGVETGAVVSCIGSLRQASLFVAVPLENRVGAGYSAPMVLEGPLELLAAQGTLGRDEETGGPFLHLHGVMSEAGGLVKGGHLIQGACPVLVTCEVAILACRGVAMVRAFSPEVEMNVFSPVTGPGTGRP